MMALTSHIGDYAKKTLVCEKWVSISFQKWSVMKRNACMGISCPGWFVHGPVEIRELVAYWMLEPRQVSLGPMVGP